ncbi:MAG: hypothetical protein KAX65_03560 [Caldilineaceae bacterium]|nr:hypothetical protein [Caldilineaceae bacterium]
MTYERTFTEKALDAGASADWITPVWEALRNVAQDGRSYCVPSETWHAIQEDLAAAGVACWGVSLHWVDNAYFITFSVQAGHAETVDAMIGGKPTGGRGKAIFMLLVALVILAGAMALVAAVGGAL